MVNSTEGGASPILYRSNDNFNKDIEYPLDS